MLRPNQMSKVIITGPNNVLENVIKELHNLKILHIVEHSKSELADIGKPLESAARLSEILVRLRSLSSTLNIKKEESKPETKKGIQEIEAQIKKLSLEVGSNTEELKKTEESISRSHMMMKELEMLKDIELPLEYFTPYRTLTHFTGHIKIGTKELEKKLQNLTEKFMLFNSTYNKKEFIVLFVDSELKDEAFEILQKSGFTQIILSNLSGLKGEPFDNLKKIEYDMQNLQQKKEDIKKQLGAVASEYKDFIIAADNYLSEQLEKAEAPLKFAATSSSFLIKGWIPSDNLSHAIEKLSKAAKNKVYIHFEPAKKTDKVPVKLKNPRFAKPFEFFIDLYSMPTYKEIDPTFFIFLTFPIFFGIMLGDVGYGAVSVILFWILRKKIPKARNLFNVLLLASFVTILFGFLFGEFFGYPIVRPIINRENDLIALAIISVLIGFVHVNIGFIVGFINEMKNHGLRMAIYAKASWFIFEMGFALLVLSLMGKISFSLMGVTSVKLPLLGLISASTIASLIVIILSIVMISFGEGLKGIIELPGLFTNVLSYVRLMAIGFSSVILALIVNDSAKGFFHLGGFFVIIGVIILMIGHLLNLALGLLGSFLHSLRLHYVEFFSKFFHGGAKKYQPFGEKYQ